MSVRMTRRGVDGWGATGDTVDVDVWWTPDCDHLHLETNPVTIPFACPDGVASGDVEVEQP